MLLRWKNWKQKILLMCQLICAEAGTLPPLQLARSADEVWQPTVRGQEEAVTSLPSVLYQSAALAVLRWQICIYNKCPRTALQLLFASRC